MYKFKKKSNLYLTVFMAVWLICGFIYWANANLSRGKCFQFQEDILVSLKTKEFLKQTGVSSDGIDVTNLVKSFDEKDQTIRMGKYGTPMFTFNMDKINSEWVNYYEKKLVLKSINYFSVMEEVKGDNLIGLDRYIRLKVTFYFLDRMHENKSTMSEIMYFDSNYDKFMKPINTTYIWVREQDYKLEKNFIGLPSGKRIEVKYFPIAILQILLKDSVNYIDDDYEILKSIQQNNFIYPMIDFIYFSAVTITTLGYGDILPNSTNTRIIVMIESLLGVILAGLFISQKFKELSEEKERKASFYRKGFG